MKKNDTSIRHVTKPGMNLFAELGFPAMKAKRLQTQSRQRIDQARALKKKLMSPESPSHQRFPEIGS